jgi:xanthine dehydrogenase YagS FAD-binding subunit
VAAADARINDGPKAVSAALLQGARTTPQNAFKTALVERTLASVLQQARA